jgi:hypothetical protein
MNEAELKVALQDIRQRAQIIMRSPCSPEALVEHLRFIINAVSEILG